jgi:hypothetical protein
MKARIAPIPLLLFAASFVASVHADSHLSRPAGTAAPARDIARADLTIKLPPPKYPSCQALIDVVQKKTFSRFRLQPAASVIDSRDPECMTNPMFEFSADIAKRAALQDALRGASSLPERAANQPERAVGVNLSLGAAALDKRDVIARLVDAQHNKQYGTFVRELGLLNGALSCSPRSGVRVLDLVLAEILAASMEGGLDNEAEQRKCVDGVFNAALNTFDQVQDTGFSLIQTVLTRDIAKARALLVPDYPVCALGIWVYDFTTGKLAQLRDEEACKGNWFTDIFSSRRDSSGKTAQQRRYRYLNGYLDQFADPRRFGLGFCSQYFVSGARENFTCDVGVTCKRTGLRPGEREIIEGVNTGARRDVSEALRGITGPLSGQPNPTRFGLPFGAAEDFLCGRSAGEQGDLISHDRGAFGEPGPNDPGFSPSRNFFQCQASTLFATKQDPMTACLLAGIAKVANEGKRLTQPDGDRGPNNPRYVVGGIKDPSCIRQESKKDLRGWVVDRDKAASSGTLAAAMVKAQSGLLNDVLASVVRGYDSWGLIETLTKVVTETRVTVLTPDDNGAVTNNDVTATVHQNESGKYSIRLWVDLDRADDWSAQAAKALTDAFKEIVTRMLDSKEDKPKNETTPNRGNQDPGLEGSIDSACTSALDRAMDALRQCNTPDLRNQAIAIGNGGLPAGGTIPHDPTNTDPDPQGIGASVPLGTVMQGLLACVDQYGADIRAMSGAAYGPGGCLPPLTLCNSKECQLFQTNCTSWGQWQCSFALCREDTYCCGSPSGSRGGAGGNSPGSRAGNAINCGDGNVWNPAKLACQVGNICPEGQGINPGTGFCETVDGFPGRRGPGGDPELGDRRGGVPRDPGPGNTIPGTGNNIPNTNCPAGMPRQPNGGCLPP